MEFKNKIYDGDYEVSEIQINHKGQIIRGLLYFPPKRFIKPYPLVIYFHGFPELFTLTEIIKKFSYLLELGYSILVFNFRGYRISEGVISINSQISDALKMIEFAELMAKKEIFDINKINILAYDFGGYIALIICSKTKIIESLIIISPILDLKKHINNKDFPIVLSYINRFLPGYIKGIGNIEKFIELTRKELNSSQLDIGKLVNQLKIKKLKVITGQNDKITPISEVNQILQNVNINYELSVINDANHDLIDDEELEKLNKEIIKFYA
ncbi:MAG: alpha/beta hydrolase family protein [Candidatus Thorarchaeota archaeon]